MSVVALPASYGLASRIARDLGAELAVAEVRRFPDGEVYVRLPRLEDPAVLVQSLAPPQNDRFVELMLAIEAARGLGVGRVVAVVPYLAYARQDRRFMEGEPVSVGALLRSLEQGARSAVVVAVACAAAGIIVGVVNLTGTGLRFSSLVVSLSQGIPLLALALVAFTSLLLGMGLPVTASYIVLVILAGPGLMDLGLPLLTAHMIVFWYSQDANVTPPVALESFAASGIAGSSPMKTAFTSWKLAKGIYIIPVVMAYHPLLLNGPTGAVIQTVVFCAIAIMSFVFCLERYYIVKLTWPETILHGAAAIALIWVGDMVNYAGFAMFILLTVYQIITRKRAGPQRDTARP